MKRLIACMALAMMVCAAGVSADTTLVFADMARDGSSNESGRMEIATGRVRMGGDKASEGYMIFDADKAAIYAINPDDRSYFVVDEAFASQMGNMQSKIMAQMESQLAQLPPAQREQVKKMMMQRMPKQAAAAPAPEPDFKRTGKSKKVGEWRCDVMEVYVDGVKKAEQCVVDPEDLDIPEQDFDAIIEMQQLAMKIARQLGPMGESIGAFSRMMSTHMPVEYIDYDNGRADNHGQLQSVDHAEIKKSRLEIPAGYKRQEIPEL